MHVDNIKIDNVNNNTPAKSNNKLVLIILELQIMLTCQLPIEWILLL